MKKMPISIAECRDCMEAMREFPDKFFELAVVDPEYRDENSPDISMRKKGLMNEWRGAPKREYFNEVFRVSKNQIIFGGNYFTEYLPPNNNWFIWYKNNDGTHHSMAEMAWVSIRKNVRVFELRPMGLCADWHPTGKPTALYKYLFETYAKARDKILDTHLGSGRSRIVANVLGLDFWGYEINPAYFLDQERDFKKATTMPLFDEIKNPEQGKFF